jgi:hypothetical protein
MTAAPCIPAPAAMLAVLLAAIPGAARAQLIGQYYPSGIPGYQTWLSDAVADRPRSEYDPLGVRVGSFVIRPALSESVGYDSNVSGAPHPLGSAQLNTRGSVAAASDWSRDALGASVGFSDQRDLQHNALSHTDWTAGLGFAHDIGDSRATVAYTHIAATTVPAEIGTLTAGNPVTVTVDDARARYQATLGRVTLEPAVEVAAYRFSVLGPGGASQAANDRNAFSGSLTAGYRLAPGRSLVLVLDGTDADYTTRTPGLATADYHDVSLAGGLDFRSGALFRTRALLGYERRDYASAALSGTSGPLAELDLIWTPTQMTTVTGQVSHSLQNAVAAGQTENYGYTVARLVVDHEYLRNVLLQAFGSFQNAGYQMRSETQHVVTAGASVTWLLNRRLSVIGRVLYSQSTDHVNATLNQTDKQAELALEVHL